MQRASWDTHFDEIAGVIGCIAAGGLAALFNIELVAIRYNCGWLSANLIREAALL